ncbi:MAG: hypothetical protein DDT40_01883 [candidate division WS2 bacterium]|nr:hypothetical protein [Candidatus Psychracetigena formicireducens]
MAVGDWFTTFCSNILMSDDTVSTISTRYRQFTKRINLDYYGSTSEVNHSLYVGSYGRGTEIYASDIDMLVQLPYETYVKFKAPVQNGSGLERKK